MTLLQVSTVCDVKFHHIEGSGRKFLYIASKVSFSNIDANLLKKSEEWLKPRKNYSINTVIIQLIKENLIAVKLDKETCSRLLVNLPFLRLAN